MIIKRLLRPHRLRQIPSSFSWVDHRLIRHHHLRACDHRAWALYLFLVTVGDAQGLSYYSEAAIGRQLKMDPLQLASAREQLGWPGLSPIKNLSTRCWPCWSPRPSRCPGAPVRLEADKFNAWATSCAGLWQEVPMINYPTFCQLQMLLDEKHLTVAQVAVELQLDPKTVELGGPSRYRPRQRTKRPSKLDSFKGQIVALLERHPYSAQQLLQQLRQQGYAGGYTILKEFVRQVRPVRKPAFLMLEFAPGECAQVDWGSFGSVTVGTTRRRLSFFVMVLCYSRMMYVEFTLSEGMEQFLSCHRHAFEFFGGVPAKVMIDNLKVGVLDHPLGAAGPFQPRYLDLAAHYGFEPVACKVRKANEKGRVENGVGYVKKNFLNGLEIPSFGRQSRRPSVAGHRGQRPHPRRNPPQTPRTVRPGKAPAQTPAGLPYDCAVVRPISANGCCHVMFDTNRYSVPHLYASQQLTLKIYPDQLLFFHHEKLIATHLRSYDRRQDISNPDHIQELLAQRHEPATKPACWLS